MSLPLAGGTVLVTRAPERSRTLTERLRALGADVVVAPVTATAPPESTGPLDDAVRALDSYAWVAVTSVNAVDALVAAAARTGVALAGRPPHGRISNARSGHRGSAGPSWAAVGPATARALRDAGVPVALEASGTAAGLVAAFPGAGAPSAPAATGTGAVPATAAAATPDGPERESRVLLPLGDLARTVLADGLCAAGWEVDAVVAYRTVRVPLPDDVADLARAGRIDVAVVAAGSAARALAQQLGKAAPPVVAIGQPSADAAAAAGLTVVGVADHPTDHALADALCAAACANHRSAPTTRSDA